MNFRTDINGLRAIAVLSVVVFHIDPDILSGGFTGVDIFFVLSGYLMTGITVSRLEQGQFKFASFYKSRATRILPALSALCLTLVIFGYFYLQPLPYFSLIKHSINAMFFTSNFTFWLESGYFDTLSNEKWLLHSWSLSVEWQFYLLFPVFTALIWKAFGKSILIFSILTITIISFIFSIYSSIYLPSSGFFLLPSRLWELTFGSIAFLLPIKFNSQTIGKRIEFIGLILIVFSIFYIDENDQWPGWLALLPVLGTYLIIQANQKESLITNNFLFQHIGKWSYSIYLWHWPLAVLLWFEFKGNYSFTIIISYILSSLFLGFISFHLFEKSRFNLKKTSALFSSALTICLISFAGHYSLSKISSDVYENQTIVQNEQQDWCDFIKLPGINCKVFGDANNIDFVIWGDSHADSLSFYLAEQNRYNFISFGSHGCPPLYGVRRADRLGNSINCNLKANDEIFNKILKEIKPKTIFLIGRWSLYTQGWKINGELQAATHFLCLTLDCDDNNATASLETWKSQFIKTTESLSTVSNLVVFKGTPILKVSGANYTGDDDQILTQEEHENYQKATNDFITNASKKLNFDVIDYGKHLCQQGICKVKEGEKYLYIDDNHLTVDGWGDKPGFILNEINSQLN